MTANIDSVVVTGALGGAGRWVVDRLLDEGYDVVGLDRRLPEGDVPDGADFFAVDLTDGGEAGELIADAGPDAVVHLAAIPDPLNHAGSRVFENNVLSAYAVLDAAGRADAKVVWASSESAYGFPFADSVLKPEYLPVDEAHPLRPEDPYGASKVAGEAVAAMVARRDGVPVASVRPSWIQYPGRYEIADVRASFDLDDLESAPPGAPDVGGVGNFWSYVDVRDFAGFVEAALRADFEGHEPYLCHAPENYLGVETAQLFEALYDEGPDASAFDGEASAFTTAKAERDLSWSAEHDWRTAEDEAVEGPNFG
ncbi:NAD(P)-dependent oxidoreductase [Halorussus rarus]|uniref:NAD-dependent epimerase/dehydratase family protein n=1 Tax=Halorussus TaxID=1070314 RepID=UPI001F086CA2|nr:NAD(P)-dependent oxidoreductase [Halorussus rarus]